MQSKLNFTKDSKGRSKIHLGLLKETQICDVWQHNFIEAIDLISELIEEYNVIAMDTEFPGIKQFNLKNDNGEDDKELEYQQIRENVKNSKIIQIGVSIANEEGEVPVPCSTWQFNFKFEEEYKNYLNIMERKDAIKPEVLTLLKKAGINFEELRVKGINPRVFSEYCFGSGLVLNEDLKWIVFHGGFDFGYLIQMLNHSGVPDTSDEFQNMMKIYFPQAYDLKYSLRENLQLRDVGLTKLAQRIKVERIGPEHQAGSDALLTLSCYFQLKQQPTFKNEALQIEKQINIIYGIGKGYVSNNRWKSFDPSQFAANQDLNQLELQFDNTFNAYQQYQFDYGFYPQDNQYQQYFQSMQQQQQYNFYGMQYQGFNEQDQNSSINNINPNTNKKKNY